MVRTVQEGTNSPRHEKSRYRVTNQSTEVATPVINIGVDISENFRKFSAIVNVTARLGTTVHLNENMHEYIRLLNIGYTNIIYR